MSLPTVLFEDAIKRNPRSFSDIVTLKVSLLDYLRSLEALSALLFEQGTVRLGRVDGFGELVLHAQHLRLLKARLAHGA